MAQLWVGDTPPPGHLRHPAGNSLGGRADLTQYPQYRQFPLPRYRNDLLGGTDTSGLRQPFDRDGQVASELVRQLLDGVGEFVD
ncbi:hypothetical protein [Microbispora sp. H10885]|uniref:hypothetical protein n=1 Tax=Microbispora sp. H10885 TaxID=2729110 RepID=UPI0016037153|nr:hypothetical protein [Microbispora sp. H10885]